MRFITLLIVLSLSLTLSKEVIYGKTQKRYERKAILSAQELVRIRSKIRVRAVLCPKGKLLCITVGDWKFRPDRNLKNLIVRTLLEWVVTQRFDKIIFGKGKVTLLTARSKIEKDTEFYRPLYIKDERKFINKNFAPIVGSLLRDSLEIRYKELPYEEQELFINTKAKELGIPAEVIESLMNSSFLFSFDIEKIDLYFLFHRTRVKKGKKKVDIYTTSITAKTLIQLRIYKFDPVKNKYFFYKRLKGQGTVTHSESFPFLPVTLLHIEHIVKKLIVLSAKASAIDLSMKLKKDDNFAIFSVVKNRDKFRVFSEVGVLEDLRIDAPFIIFRYIDGSKRRIGLLKVRKVADNCKKPRDSTFALIKGKAEEGDLIRELPWSGVFLDLAYRRLKVEILQDEIWSGFINMNSLSIGMKSDLGFITNSPSLSEVWLSFDLFLDFGSIKVYNGEIKEDFSDNFGFGGDLKLGKRFYILNTGVYLEPSLGILYSYYALKSEKGNEASASYISFNGHLETGFTLSHESEIFLGISQPLFKRMDIDIDVPLYTPSSPPNIMVAPQIYAGIRFSIPTTGFFSKIFAKGKKCR